MSYEKPLPRIDELSRPFWTAARANFLSLPRCNACKTVHTYMEPWCSRCGHEGATWERLSGRGKIWATCRFHKLYFKGFEDDAPYNVAMVELEEGAKLVTNIVGLPRDTLDEMPIGMPVEAVFEPVTPEITLVKFRPSVSGAGDAP